MARTPAERERLLAALAVAVSLAVFISWIRLYNLVAARLAPSLVALHRFKLFALVPVPTDQGTIVEASTAIILAMIPFHLIYARPTVNLRERLEEQVAEFLAVYASIAASSRSTYEALARAADMIGPPLGVYLERMARLYRSTGSLHQAYQEAFQGLPRRVRVLVRSIVTAARAGGNPSLVLAATAAHAREMRRLARMTRGRLSEYSFVVALASITFAVAAGVVLGLLEQMRGAQLPGATVAVDTGLVMGLYYYSMLMIIVASAVVMARVIQGHTLLAPKYVALLMLISLTALLVSPQLITAGGGTPTGAPQAGAP